MSECVHACVCVNKQNPIDPRTGQQTYLFDVIRIDFDVTGRVRLSSRVGEVKGGGPFLLGLRQPQVGVETLSLGVAQREVVLQLLLVMLVLALQLVLQLLHHTTPSLRISTLSSSAFEYKSSSTTIFSHERLCCPDI